MPDLLAGLGVHCQQRFGETPGVLALVVSLGYPSPRPAVGFAPPAGHRVGGLVLADQRIEHPVGQGGPLPERPAGQVRRCCDLAGDLARGGVDELAGLVVGQVERLGGGDHRVPVDHDPRRQGAAPEHRAVVAVDGHQRIEPRLFPLMPRDVPERDEHPSPGRHGRLRRRAVTRHGHELRQIRRAGQAVTRLRVVVRAVVEVAPVVRAGGGGLGPDVSADDALPARPKHTKDLGLRHVGRIAHGDQAVGDVVGELDSFQVALGDIDAFPVQSGVVGRLAGGCHVRAATQLQEHDQLRLAGDVHGESPFHVAQHHTDAATHSELLRQRTRRGHRRRAGRNELPHQHNAQHREAETLLTHGVAPFRTG